MQRSDRVTEGEVERMRDGRAGMYREYLVLLIIQSSVVGGDSEVKYSIMSDRQTAQNDYIAANHGSQHYCKHHITPQHIS